MTVGGKTGDWMKLPRESTERGRRWSRVRPWDTLILGKVRRKWNQNEKQPVRAKARRAAKEQLVSLERAILLG